MHIKSVGFSALEFQDIKGTFRLIRGCSLCDREEFGARLNQLYEILLQASDSETIQQLYDQNSHFRHLCNRCLELCNIQPDWLDLNMMSQLLLSDGEAEGLLVQLNFPSSKRSIDKEKGATYAELLAALWGNLEDLQKAFDIASQIPAEELIDIIEARSKQVEEAQMKADPKAQGEALKRKWQEQAKKDLSAFADIPN